ncbi:hypothetical protein [Streptosporangium roseum]|uniref:Uncharacterized protein n=1 Tax=Streptosporangium roseum (strain ATCC 12428 / DSM 43021 / JCM 3005 / KCTC 9067 / NCIMB 10171 / NRRL 2505 / NI 9100) TaxID=479432 RepID=D2B5X8_STRRD|nr:hypothetical protein [Streptosporangium roseum]ACZ91432.1 hypothetical protein Sros_8797 [Streptosporangium roseum DSM 43021]
MREIIRFLGIVMVLQGISGTIDQLATQPVFGLFLNLFNRLVVNRLDFLAGYEIFANLILAALGGALVIAARRA